jgi:hypothetical protein
MGTNGTGFTCRPSRHNRLPMSLVKVPSCGTTMTDALSSDARLKLLKRVKGNHCAIARIKHVGFTPRAL